MNKQKGFTLIELLVEIAVIALLMSILMPAMQRVKKQARSVACLSKLKQCGVFLRCTPTTTTADSWRALRPRLRTIGGGVQPSDWPEWMQHLKDY